MRNKNLDGARGLAALTVPIAHSLLHYGGIPMIFLKLSDFPHVSADFIAIRLWDTIFQADAAVVLFFVLSGYVLSRGLEKRNQSPANAAIPFFVRRLFRLLPSGIAAAIPLIFLTNIDARTTIETMLLVNHSVNGPIWSLQVEWIGCAVVFAVWATGSRIFALLALAAICYVIRSQQSWLLMFLPAFILGYLVPSVPERIWRQRVLLPVSLVALLLADLVLGKLSLPMRVFEVLGAFGVVGTLTSRPIRFLHSRPVQFIGRISYPFYLCGAPAIFLVAPLADRITKNHYLLQQAAVLACLSVPCAILGGWLIHKFVEVPGIQIGNLALARFRKSPETAQPQPH